MHQLVNNGIVQAETKLLMDHLKTLGYPWEKLATFASSGWSVASSIGTPARVRDLFSDARKLPYQRNHVFNPPASEMLLIMPVVLCFAQQVVAKELGRRAVGNALESYELLRDLVIAVKSAKTNADAHVSRLKVLPSLHLAKFVQAYGTDRCKPKHHFAQHIYQQYLHLGCLVDGFVDVNVDYAFACVFFPILLWSW